MTVSPTIPDSLKKYLIPVFDRKVLSVTALDVQKLTSYTDILVIVEAGSHRQATAVAQHVIKELKAQKTQVIGAEGVKEGEWALLDYGQIIIHIFETNAKSFYDLEGFWTGAVSYDLSEFGSTAAPEEHHDDI